MIGLFEYHVFAHVNGRYQTAGGSRFAPELRSELEQFFFGQTNDDKYLASLEAEPGLIWRRCGEKIAFTRVRRGEDDTSGRATLRFETLVAPSKQSARIAESLAAVAVAQWREKDGSVEVLASELCSEHELHPDIVSETMMALDQGRRVIRSADSVSLKDVEALTRRLSRRKDFMLCYKSLNERIPAATVNLVARAQRATSTPRVPSGGGAATKVGVQDTVTRPAQPARRGGHALLIALLIFSLLQTSLLVFLLIRDGGPASVEESTENRLKNEMERHRKKLLSQIDDIAKRGDKALDHGFTTIRSDGEAQHEAMQHGFERLSDIQLKANQSVESLDDSIQEFCRSTDDALTKQQQSLDKLGMVISSMPVAVSESMRQAGSELKVLVRGVLEAQTATAMAQRLGEIHAVVARALTLVTELRDDAPGLRDKLDHILADLNSIADKAQREPKAAEKP